MANIHIGTITKEEIAAMRRNMTEEELQEHLKGLRGSGAHKNKRDKRAKDKLRKFIEED